MEITGDNKRSETDRGRGYARGGRAVGQQQWTNKKNTLLTSRPSFGRSRPRQQIKKHSCHFANKGPDSQNYVFPVVMYTCDSWTLKKAECPRIDAFKLWCCRRLLRVPWTVRRSNQSILKEINLDYSLEELMLKLQYLGHIMRRANSLEKTLVLGKIEDRGEGGDKGWDGWMASST